MAEAGLSARIEAMILRHEERVKEMQKVYETKIELLEERIMKFQDRHAFRGVA